MTRRKGMARGVMHPATVKTTSATVEAASTHVAATHVTTATMTASSAVAAAVSKCGYGGQSDRAGGNDRGNCIAKIDKTKRR